MKKTPKAGTPTNFRLSAAALRTLDDVAKQTGLTKTEVIELCVAREALKIPEIAQRARAALAEIAAQNLQGNQPDQK